MLDDLPVADGLQGGSVLCEAAGEELLHFFHQAAGEHLIHADVDPGVEIGGLPGEAEKS